MAKTDPPWAANGSLRAPTQQEQSLGFQCGPADPALFNWLFNQIYGEVNHVIQQAGLTPDEADLTQLWQAIEVLGLARLASTSPPAHCRFVFVDASTCRLKRHNGSHITVGGAPRPIPHAGIDFLAADLSPEALHYAYVYWDEAADTLRPEWSPTGYVIGADGLPCKADDTSRTLVGMAYVDASGQFRDERGARHVLSWFNRRAVLVGAPASGSTTSTTPVQVGHTASFLSWGGTLPLIGTWNVSCSASGSVTSYLGVNGSRYSRVQIGVSTPGIFISGVNHGSATVEAGLHTLMTFGMTSAGTATWGIDGIVHTTVEG